LENSEHTKQIYNAAKDIIEKSTIIMP